VSDRSIKVTCTVRIETRGSDPVTMAQVQDWILEIQARTDVPLSEIVIRSYQYMGSLELQWTEER
jgi:hypothetical protein